MYKAQISDGEQIPCDDYDHVDGGVELRGEDGDFLAFVPYAHLLWLGEVTDDSQTKW